MPTSTSTSPAATPRAPRRLGRLALHEARDELDAHAGHPLEDAVVLRGEDGRRREEGDLPAGADGAVDGAHRDLRLAEADVAAHQPVHRLVGDHVRRDLAKDGCWSGVG